MPICGGRVLTRLLFFSADLSTLEPVVLLAAVLAKFTIFVATAGITIALDDGSGAST